MTHPEPDPTALQSQWKSAVDFGRQADGDPAMLEEFRSLLSELPFPLPDGSPVMDFIPGLLPYPDALEVLIRHIVPAVESAPSLLILAEAAWFLGCGDLFDGTYDRLKTLLPATDSELLHLYARTRPLAADQLAAYQQIVEIHPQDRVAWEAILSLTR